jgi:hypothetical protein
MQFQTSEAPDIANLITFPLLKIYFHPDEMYLPSSFSFFSDNSQLFEKDGTTLVKSIESVSNDKGMFDQQTLSLLQCGEDRQKYILQPLPNLEKEIKLGTPADKLSQVPIYYWIRKDGNGNIYLTYMLFYPYNGSYNILFLQEAGQHWADMEQMTFEFIPNGGQEAQNYKLNRIYYGSHGDKDGVWVDENKAEKEGSSYVTYVAKNGHGFYPSSAVYFRLFGLANDFTLKNDKQMAVKPDLSNLVYIPYKNEYNQLSKDKQNQIGLAYYCGLLGVEGINSLMYKDWFYNVPRSESAPKAINTKTFAFLTTLLYIGIVLLLLALYKVGNIKLIQPYRKYYYLTLLVIFIVAVFVTKYVIKKFSV